MLSKKIGLIEGVIRAKRPLRLPVVLTQEQVKKVIDHMNGVPRLMAILLYGGRIAIDGMLPPSSQGYRFFSQ